MDITQAGEPLQIERSGRRQRVALALLAVAGVVAFELVLMLPWIIGLGLGTLWFNRVYAYAGAAIALLILWWSFQPTPRALKRGLPRADEPGLFAELDGLTQGIDAPPIDEVVLDDSFNAGALVLRTAWRPWRTRRVLVLGVPLLACLDVRAVRAVIAHEMGHFSRRHGRLGHWLYRAREGWLWFARQAGDDDSVLDRAAARFAAWFGPWLGCKSFAHARACEYEADAFAADVVTREAMAAALAVVEARGMAHAAFMGDGIAALQRELGEPPADLVARLVRDQQALDLGAPALAQVLLEAVPDAQDTHPVTAHRLAALGSTLAQGLALASSWQGPAAGPAWLQGWEGAVRQHDADWALAQRRRWRQESLRMGRQTQRLQALRAAGDVCDEQAWLEWRLGEASAALASARLLLQRAAGAPLPLYVSGVARLSLGDALGRQDLEACILADKAWVAACRAALDTRPAFDGDGRERERNLQLLERAGQRRQAALQPLLAQIEAGSLGPAPLDETSRGILGEVLAGEPSVQAAWLVGRQAHRFDGRTYEAAVLLLRVDPRVLAEQRRDEDDVIADALDLLKSVLRPHLLRVVWTTYTTEPLPPAVAAALQADASLALRGG